MKNILLQSFILVSFLFSQSCTKAKLKSLESNRCSRCRNYLDEKFDFLPRPHQTKDMKTIDNIACGPNYKALAKKRFVGKEKITAVNSYKVKKFNDHLHCLIGLDFETYKTLLPKVREEHRFVKDSTLWISMIVDTSTKRKDGEIVWAGTKGIRSRFKEIDGKLILIGTDWQKMLFDRCIINADK